MLFWKLSVLSRNRSHSIWRVPRDRSNRLDTNYMNNGKHKWSVCAHFFAFVKFLDDFQSCCCLKTVWSIRLLKLKSRSISEFYELTFSLPYFSFTGLLFCTYQRNKSKQWFCELEIHTSRQLWKNLGNLRFVERIYDDFRWNQFYFSCPLLNLLLKIRLFLSGIRYICSNFG